MSGEKHLIKIKAIFLLIIILLATLIVAGQFYLVQGQSKTLSVIYGDSISVFGEIKQTALNKFDDTYLEKEIPSVEEPAAGEKSAIGVPVLVYHGILEESDGFNIEAEEFKDQLVALKNDGWETVSLADFNAFVKGEKRLPEKSFVLTFDDGRKDSFYNADPVLEELNYTAVMFVISGESLHLGKQNSNFHLNKNELRKMKNTGRWELHAHAKNGHRKVDIDADGNQGYFYSNKMWLPEENRIETEEEFQVRVYEDLLGAKEDLERVFGVEVTGFAYPFGDYGKDSVNFPESKKIITKITGEIYETSYYQNWVGLDYTYNYPFEERTLIKRIEPSANWNGEELLHYLEFGKEKEFNYDSKVSGFDSWADNSGILKDSGSTISLSTQRSKPYGFSFLDGTYSWKDYDYNMKVKSFNAESFSLMSRVESTGDYYACIFSEKNVRIIEMKNNKATVLSEKKLSRNIPSQNLKVAMSVKGKEVKCSIGGISLKHIVEGSDLTQGGIGFGVWNPDNEQNPLVISEIKVNN